MNLLLLLTFGNSLDYWKKNNILDREILPYKELFKLGVSTKIFSFGNKLDENKIALKNIKLITIFNKRKKRSKAILFLSSIIFILKHKNRIKCDLIKTNQVWGGFIAVILKKIIKSPLLIRAGWEPYLQTSKYNKNFFKLFIYYINSYISYKYSDHIIVSSNHIKEFIVSTFKINSSKITIINNYIDTNIFYNKIIDTIRIPNRILFVGRLSKQKNISELIKAISYTKFGLDIIGDGKEKNKLINLVKKNNLNVKFLGKIQNDKLADYYNKYRVYILPSLVEGNPKSLLEAMSCGCAVICSDVDGNNSIIKHKYNGYLTKTDKISIYNSINEIMKNETLRYELRKNSIEFIRKKCDLNKNLILEKKIYQSLINVKKTFY